MASIFDFRPCVRHTRGDPTIVIPEVSSRVSMVLKNGSSTRHFENDSFSINHTLQECYPLFLHQS